MMPRAIITGLVALALMAAPAFAGEQGTGQGDEAAGPQLSAPAQPGTEDVEAVVCPDCGRTVIFGRHGQVAQTTVCPYCGKEICTTEEAEKPLCYGVDAAFLSKYVSRGVTLTDGTVFQPNAWISYRNLSVGVWGNMELTDDNGRAGDFSELDFSAGYSWQLDRLNLAAGGIYYVFPGTGSDDTAELYAGISYDTILKPTLTVFYDIAEADGMYATLGIGHSFEIPMPSEALAASLELSAQAGFGTKEFNEYNAGTYHSTFTDMVFTAGFPVTIYDNYTVKPVVSYSSVLDRTIRTKNEHNDNVIWGTVISASY